LWEEEKRRLLSFREARAGLPPGSRAAALSPRPFSPRDS
jgi:hypothetical protein